MKNRMRMLFVAVLAGILLLSGCKATKIDLSEYVTIEVEGYDGQGEATVSIDKKQFLKDYKDLKWTRSGRQMIMKELGIDDDKEAQALFGDLDDYYPAAEYILDSIDGSLNRKSGLANGDRITFRWDCDDELLKEIKKYCGAEVIAEKITKRVKGLTETASAAENPTQRPAERDYAGIEIALLTDVGSLMDGGYNQSCYEGIVAFAEANRISYEYYQPENGSNATDNDRLAAMRKAIKAGAKVIVAPGFLQVNAMTTAAKENPNVRFIFVDGWALDDGNGKLLKNVTAIVYHEEQAGYLAGYAVVKDGYTKLGGTFAGGGSNPSCNRYAYGFAQGARDAAEELGIDVELRISYKYDSNFSASPELAAQTAAWYSAGTQIIFCCGGSMVMSVIQAADETKSGKVVGVDTDQCSLSDRVVTSAMKGIRTSVQKTLDEWYNGAWDQKLAGRTCCLGAADDCVLLPMMTSRFANFSEADYDAVYARLKSGSVVPDTDVDGSDQVQFWMKAFQGTNLTVIFEE